VDLTPCPQARVGSRVELWGEQVPIDSVAQSAGTLGYELMCAIAPRVTMRLDAFAAAAHESDKGGI
jgi:alanine racemase